MADITLTDALTTTRDRILLLASYAIPDASGAYAFTDQRGSFSQYFELLLQSMDVIYPTQDTQTWTVKADLRFNIGQWTQDIRGQVQIAAWTFMPMASQIFVQYRRLNPPAMPTPVPYLDPANTIVHNARTQIIDTGYWIVFPWTLVYITRFLRCGL